MSSSLYLSHFCHNRDIFLLLFIHPVQLVAYHPSYRHHIFLDCRISALSDPSQLLNRYRLHLPNSPKPFPTSYCLSISYLLSYLSTQFSSYLSLSTFCLLYDLSLFIFTPTVPVFGPPRISFLPSFPRDKEPRWHDGSQLGQEQFAPRLQQALDIAG